MDVKNEGVGGLKISGSMIFSIGFGGNVDSGELVFKFALLDCCLNSKEVVTPICCEIVFFKS